MIISLIASLASVAAADFPDDPAQYSVWMQQSCRIQQVGRSGGEPADHTGFCVCLDSQVREASSPATYRAFALGSQGALREQAMIEDWEAARDTAMREAAALPTSEQTQLTAILQSALGACMNLVYQGE